MTKAELVAATAATTGDTEKDVEELLDAVIAEVTEGLTNDGDVDLGPLGNFVTRVEGEHTGSNPQTHEPMQIPAQTRVLFHPSSALREAVQPPAE